MHALIFMAAMAAGSDIGESLAVKTGATIEREGVLMHYIGVVSDSRCPKGAQCVWAGEVVTEWLVDGSDVSLRLDHDPANAQWRAKSCLIQLTDVIDGGLARLNVACD